MHCVSVTSAITSHRTQNMNKIADYKIFITTSVFPISDVASSWNNKERGRFLTELHLWLCTNQSSSCYCTMLLIYSLSQNAVVLSKYLARFGLGLFANLHILSIQNSSCDRNKWLIVDFVSPKSYILSSKCTIKRLTDRFYLNTLMGEFTALPRLTGFRGRPVGPRRGKRKRERESRNWKGDPTFARDHHHWLGDLFQKWGYGWGKKAVFWESNVPLPKFIATCPVNE